MLGLNPTGFLLTLALLSAFACDESQSLVHAPDDGAGGADMGPCGIAAAVGSASGRGVAGPGDIRIDPSRTFQTIVGWEAHGQAGEDDDADFPLYADALIRVAACDLGINRIRLEVQSGLENPTDHYLRMRNGEIGYEEFKCLRWTAVNDNADPNAINPGGFNWTLLDRRMERVVLPLREALAERGERLYINLTYVSFIKQCSISTYLHDDPAEYAEFLLAAFQHMKSRWGVIPDGLEIILEPDNSYWDGTDIGRAIAKTGAVLAANGFHPDFIGPSTASMSAALTYLDAMVAVPGTRNYLTEFSYHRYSGVSAATLQQIASRAEQYDLRTAMLEKLDAAYTALHEDLKLGSVSAWQQFALAFRGDGSHGNVYLGIDRSDPSRPRVIYPELTRFLRQYFQFVRPGAQRIDAVTAKPAFDPVAFVHPNGRYVVVVKAASGGNFTVEGLPAGRYGITYTTESEFDVDLPDVQLAASESLPASIPAAGALTIYQR
jgi:hypothetical protein